MKMIDSNVELFEYRNPLSKIERIGRICYKSKSEYTRESSIAFIKSLIKRGHLSVLEHATFVFECMDFDSIDPTEEVSCPFVKHTVTRTSDGKIRALFSTNLRAIIEYNLYGFLLPLYMVYPDFREALEIEIPEDYVSKYKFTELNRYEEIYAKEVETHLYTTMLFTTDRGVTHEMVRHRLASYTQESTRYCNYSNDKFGSEIKCIRPATYEDWSMGEKVTYEQALDYAEMAYMRMLKLGATAQQARGVLPTDLATTIVMTTNHTEWEHFFDLRSRAKTGAPHPNMLKVAKQAENLYYSEYNSFKGVRFK